MKPDISHYFGRQVINILEFVGNGDGWGIELAGDVVIRDMTGEVERPSDEIIGSGLLMAIFSELDTRLKFGFSATETNAEPTYVAEVVFKPLEYTIADPAYGDDPIYPQVPEEPVEVPPEPTPETPQEPIGELESADEAKERHEGGS